jgi:hypothetical protein
MEKKELILKVAERHKEWNFNGFKYDDVAEIVLTYSEGWKYEGEEMIELIDEIIAEGWNIIKKI